MRLFHMRFQAACSVVWSAVVGSPERDRLQLTLTAGRALILTIPILRFICCRRLELWTLLILRLLLSWSVVVAFRLEYIYIYIYTHLSLSYSVLSVYMHLESAYISCPCILPLRSLVVYSHHSPLATQLTTQLTSHHLPLCLCLCFCLCFVSASSYRYAVALRWNNPCLVDSFEV
jgi:hypothetical protein